MTGDREEALSRSDLDQFDLIISDLTEDAPACDKPEHLNGDPPRDEHRRHLLTRVVPNDAEPTIVKAFKMVAANYLRFPYNKDELREIVEKKIGRAHV